MRSFTGAVKAERNDISGALCSSTDRARGGSDLLSTEVYFQSTSLNEAFSAFLTCKWSAENTKTMSIPALVECITQSAHSTGWSHMSDAP